MTRVLLSLLTIMWQLRIRRFCYGTGLAWPIPRVRSKRCTAC